jgi:hypothetical protein
VSASDFTGGASDEVTLKLNGKDVLIAESYDTRQSYFEQPASFSITVGSGDSAKSFLEKYGPNSDFELRVGDALQFKGVTDAIEANGNGSATTITIRNTGGTDHQSFDAVGLPGFQFIQDPIEYDTRTHHSNMDVFERVQANDMMRNAVIVAAFVYDAANRDDKLPRKPLPRAPQNTGRGAQQ